jgi:hypothetical protein
VLLVQFDWPVLLRCDVFRWTILVNAALRSLRIVRQELVGAVEGVHALDDPGLDRPLTRQTRIEILDLSLIEPT